MTDFMDWTENALCVQGPQDDVFFPERENKDTANRAREAFCGHCPVRQDCLKFAVVNNLAGVWGGTTSRQRHSLPEDIVLIFRLELSPIQDLEKVLVVHTVEIDPLEWLEPEPELPEELLDPIVLIQFDSDATEYQYPQAI